VLILYIALAVTTLFYIICNTNELANQNIP